MRKLYDPGKGAMFRRSAKEAKHYRVWMKLLATLLSALVMMATIVYIVSILYSKFGSLTVSVSKLDANLYCLSLSETKDFISPITTLTAKSAEDVTNISVNDLPQDIDSIDGQHNGDNYLAYTFYLKNGGEDTVTYQYTINILDVTNNIDKAIRFRLYVNGIYTDYAKTRADGGGAEEGTTEFYKDKMICLNQISDFAPENITKFTVVIWIEGNDTDCTDDLLRGTIKADMQMTVIESSDSTSGS